MNYVNKRNFTLFDKNKILNKLERILDEYDKVIFFDCDIEIKGAFEKSEILNNINKKVCIISENMNLYSENFEQLKISEEEKNFLLDLYYTYEFSDKFLIISNDEKFGNLFNYVENEMLTLEEFFLALLM